ncbi:protein no-on-transient A-like [Drosophila ananassae]|uniref:protein no-on-transient A-like n=1 Tax=Drosophila ananassae TaxID=7217 RepID=UPI0013A5CCBE|nr:protein no-on-transient A-like [Drosophila ananassae]
MTAKSISVTALLGFPNKSSASACLRLCNEKCFFLTRSLRPCLVEPMEVNDDNAGFKEKALNKEMPEFSNERSIGLRFADINSVEHKYGSRWKQLHDNKKSKLGDLNRVLNMEEEKLEIEMETELLQQDFAEDVRRRSRKRVRTELWTCANNLKPPFG